MRMIDLFSGVGGFHLAGEWVWGEELDVILHCEKDLYCQRVLRKHWPAVPIIDDIHNLKGAQYCGAIDLITGGFPCQPYSVAGKRRGEKDDRALWPEMLRVIQEVKPTWVLGENVPGFINMGLDEAFTSLESEGYETETLIIPACSVDAPHKRNRIWIVAYSESFRLQGDRTDGIKKSDTRQQEEKFKRRLEAFQKWGEWAIEPRICRVVNGIPRRMDRLRGLGNAIVPQVAAVIMEGIKIVEEE